MQFAQAYIKELGTQATWGRELERVGRRDMPGAFLGVFQSNQTPPALVGTCYIQNTKSLPSTGEHWIAVGRDRRGTLAFDSFGRNEQLLRTRNMRGLGVRTAWSDPDVEQHLKSEVCGPLCLAFCRVFLEHGRAAAQKI